MGSACDPWYTTEEGIVMQIRFVYLQLRSERENSHNSGGYIN